MIAALLLAASLSDTAIDLANRWRVDDAETLARRALDEAIRCDDVPERIRALEALSIVERLRGHAPNALDLAGEALATAEATGNEIGTARAHNALGRVYADLLAEADLADEHFRAALAGAKSDARVAAKAQLNLGNLALARRNLRAARASFTDAASLATKAADPVARIAAEHNLGLTYAFQNDPAHALEAFRRALSLDERAGRTQRARILLSIAEAQRAAGESAAASKTLTAARRAAIRSGDKATLATILIREGALDESARIARELSDRGTLAIIDAYRAKALFRARKWREAAEIAARATDAAAALDEPDTIAEAATIAGSAYRRLGDQTNARRLLGRAIAAVERRRTLVAGGIDSRLRFFESELSPYAEMIELLVAAGDNREALGYAQRAKARVLGETRPPRRPMRAPRAGEAFVEYAFAGPTVYAFVVTPSETRVVALAESRARLATLAIRFARELALRNLAFRAPARTLYDALIEPLHLGDVSRLVIVPDLDLWVIPFHALIGPDDRFLIERMTLCYAPSTALITDTASPSKRRVLLAANLPDGDREVAAIRRVWPGGATVLGAVTERAFRAEADDAAIVHVAAHGVYDEADPMQSYLALSPAPGDDGRLTAEEVLRMRLASRLVILSACDMAVGRPAAGEGLVGMSWALMVAGAETVIAAKWEVDSEFTARLMVELHRGLAAGASPETALRAAQLALLRAGSTHPFYWAAFVTLSGSP